MKFVEFLNESKSKYALVAKVDLTKCKNKDQILALIKDKDDKELIKHINLNHEVNRNEVDSLPSGVSFRYKEYTAKYDEAKQIVSIFEEI